MGGDASLPADYIKAHGCKAADIMTQNVITVAPETPLDEIAVMLERNSIKRVPIVARMPPFKRASVDEYVLAAACGLNEPIAALTISPCQCS
jgi:CBS domain-containing protein